MFYFKLWIELNRVDLKSKEKWTNANASLANTLQIEIYESNQEMADRMYLNQISSHPQIAAMMIHWHDFMGIRLHAFIRNPVRPIQCRRFLQYVRHTHQCISCVFAGMNGDTQTSWWFQWHQCIHDMAPQWRTPYARQWCEFSITYTTNERTMNSKQENIPNEKANS